MPAAMYSPAPGNSRALAPSGSKTTLNGSGKAPDTILTLHPDDPRSGALFAPSGDTRYTAKTTDGTTRIHDARGRLVGTIAGQEVALGEAAAVPLTAWLRVGMPSNGVNEYYTFRDDQHRTYEWRGTWTNAHWQLELFAHDTPGGPIARFCRSHFDMSRRHSVEEIDATFALSSRAAEIEPLCVLSLLALEKNHRVSMVEL